MENEDSSTERMMICAVWQRPCGNLTGVWHVVGVVDPGDNDDDSEGNVMIPYEEYIFIHQDDDGISGHEAAERSNHNNPFDVMDACLIDTTLTFSQVFLGAKQQQQQEQRQSGVSMWTATVDGSGSTAVAMHGRVSGAIESDFVATRQTGVCPTTRCIPLKQLLQNMQAIDTPKMTPTETATEAETHPAAPEISVGHSRVYEVVGSSYGLVDCSADQVAQWRFKAARHVGTIRAKVLSCTNVTPTVRGWLLTDLYCRLKIGDTMLPTTPSAVNSTAAGSPVDHGGKDAVIEADLSKDTLEFEVDTEGMNPIILIELAGSGSRHSRKKNRSTRRRQSVTASGGPGQEAHRAEIVVGSGAATLDPAVYLTDWASTSVSVVVRDESGVSCANVTIELEWAATGNALDFSVFFCAAGQHLAREVIDTKRRLDHIGSIQSEEDGTLYIIFDDEFWMIQSEDTAYLNDEPGRVRTSVQSGILTVNLAGCRALVPAYRTGLSDPYVVFSLGHETASSTIMMDTVDPDFSESVSLAVDGSQHTAQSLLHVEVSLQWKNHHLSFKNPDFLLKNPDFVLKTDDCLHCKTGVQRGC